MRILLLVHGFNSLSQQIFVELREQGHDVSVEYDINEMVLDEAVESFCPDVIVAPYLKRAIPEHIWKKYLCLIVHPGIKGDRGPSAVDWSILRDDVEWGVTVIEAEAEMDAGPVWASSTFTMRAASKSSLYRIEITEAAVKTILIALERVRTRTFQPELVDCARPEIKGQWRPSVKQSDRKIDWQRDDTRTVLRKIRSADGVPGVLDQIYGQQVYLYDARAASGLSGKPGEIIARSGPALCRATFDGAIWIGHVKLKAGDHPFKIPATVAFPDHPGEVEKIDIDSERGYCEIQYVEQSKVGYLYFEFYNGAMGTEQCQRLLSAYRAACRRPTRIIVLMGGEDFWSNGMHLNLIEAAASPADESWRNINAINDLAEAIIRSEDHLTVAALRGNAGAGGAFLARACDLVWLREGVILNPHYKDMGNLYGSEFWTYLLPRFAGHKNAERIAETRLPMGSKQAVRVGLGDERFGIDRDEFLERVKTRGAALAASHCFMLLVKEKKEKRAVDEASHPLSDYRANELKEMRRNFYGFDPSYHVARYNFVYKIPKSRTPVTIARHRDRRSPEKWQQAS